MPAVPCANNSMARPMVTLPLIRIERNRFVEVEGMRRGELMSFVLQADQIIFEFVLFEESFVVRERRKDKQETNEHEGLFSTLILDPGFINKTSIDID